MDTIHDTRRRGWGWFDYTLLDEWGAHLHADGLAVYLVLARHASHEGRASHPALATIAAKTGLSARQVNRALARLAGFGLIAVLPRWDADGRQTSNSYTLLDLPAAPPNGGEGDCESGGDDSLAGGRVTVSQGEDDCESSKQDPMNKIQKEDVAPLPLPRPSPLRAVPRATDDPAFQAAFTAIWAAHPGRPEPSAPKRGRPAAQLAVAACPPADWPRIEAACRHYRGSPDALDGYARDLANFVREGDWREWEHYAPGARAAPSRAGSPCGAQTAAPNAFLATLAARRGGAP